MLRVPPLLASCLLPRPLFAPCWVNICIVWCGCLCDTAITITWSSSPVRSGHGGNTGTRLTILLSLRTQNYSQYPARREE